MVTFSMAKGYKEVELLPISWDSEKAALSRVHWNETPKQLFKELAVLFSLIMIIVHCAQKHRKLLLSVIFSRIFATKKKDKLL